MMRDESATGNSLHALVGEFIKYDGSSSSSVSTCLSRLNADFPMCFNNHLEKEIDRAIMREHCLNRKFIQAIRCLSAEALPYYNVHLAGDKHRLDSRSQQNTDGIAASMIVFGLLFDACKSIEFERLSGLENVMQIATATTLSGFVNPIYWDNLFRYAYAE